MKIAIFEVKPHEKVFFAKALAEHELFFSSLEADEYVLKEAKKLPFGAVSGFIYSNFTKEVLDYFPKLKLIATRSTGTDHIDKKECKSRKITILNVPEYGTNTVAEHTWGLILSLTRKIYPSIDQVKEQADFSREDLCGTDVFGKTLGLVGCGKIGTRVGEIARVFGCRVIAFDPYCSASDLGKVGFLKAELDEIYKKADIISFHAPLTPET
ncbi:MAG: NAD(P)-dependent oxidoreductase, partial [bacterium]